MNGCLAESFAWFQKRRWKTWLVRCIGVVLGFQAKRIVATGTCGVFVSGQVVCRVELHSALCGL